MSDTQGFICVMSAILFAFILLVIWVFVWLEYQDEITRRQCALKERSVFGKSPRSSPIEPEKVG